MIGLFEGLKTAEINVKRTYQFGRGEVWVSTGGNCLVGYAAPHCTTSPQRNPKSKYPKLPNELKP
jgi:hypothetical protein